MAGPGKLRTTQSLPIGETHSEIGARATSHNFEASTSAEKISLAGIVFSYYSNFYVWTYIMVFFAPSEK